MDQQMIGLDVSKAWLDGYLASSGRRLRVSNDAGGVQELVRALGDRAGCLVVMEASGGYERTAHRELVAQGVWRRSSTRNGCATSPAAWAWRRRPTGSTPVIAHYGEVRRPAPTPLPEPARAELGEILACRRRLIDEITVRKQRLEHLQSPSLRARMAKVLAFLRRRRGS